MADFGNPVADQVAPVTSGIQTLSAIMGLKQKQLEIEKGEAGVQEAQATAQQQTQTAQQRGALRQYWANFNPQSYIGPDGSISVDKFLSDPKARQAAGDLYPQVVEGMLKIKNQQLGNQQALVNLNDSTRKQFQELLGGLRTDPDVVKDDAAGRQKVQGAMGEFAVTSPEAARVAGIYGAVVQHAPPGKLAQTLSNMQLQAMSAGVQATQQAPSYTNVGSALVETNPQAAGGTLGPQSGYRTSIPPGFSTFSDPRSGNIYAYSQQNPNQVFLVGHPPAPDGQPAANPNAPPVMAPGAPQNASVMGHTDAQTYSMVRTAANEAPQTKNILHNIEILSGETKTGVGSKDIADAEAALGQYVPGFASLQDAGAKRQLLGKYTEQLAMRVTEANGYGTDQARNLVSQAIPNPNNMGPKAIQQAARFIMAQTEVSQARGAAANRYIQEHGGSSLGLQAFDSRFMQAVDPRMFDYIGLPAKERGAWLKKTFPNREAAKAFLDRTALVAHDGGFDYSGQ